MVGLIFAFHQHVVYVHLHIPSNLVREHAVHLSLVGGSCVLQSKGHNFVLVQPLVDNKRGLLLIVFVHKNLVVSRKCVHET